MFLRSECRVVMSVTISAYIRLYPQLLIGGLMPYLRYLCLLVQSGVQHLFVVFLFCLSSSCVPYVVSNVSDCPILIAPTVFSSVYLKSQQM